MNITTVGLDLAKNVFQVHAVDARGHVALKKTLKRKGVLIFFANLPKCLIGMEAGAGAHYWARELGAQGHTVKLMPAQYVKPYLKGNKHDANDAAGICEAVTRPSMRFVGINTVEQQDLQMLLRIRSRRVAARVALINQIRGLMGEYGIVFGQGIAALKRGLQELLAEADNALTNDGQERLAELRGEWTDLDRRIAEEDARIERVCASREPCRRLMSIPGIGPKTAIALVAAVNDAQEYRNGRALAASFGLTPKEHSSGGKQQLLGISKRGNVEIRTLLIHGARTVLRHASKRRERGQADALTHWALNIQARRHVNIATVALANKNARIAWALLRRGEYYRPHLPSQTA